MEERFGVRGTVEVIVRRADGSVLRRVVHNVVTNAGKAAIAALINGVRSTPFQYVAIGVGDSSSEGTCAAEDATQTALGAEIARKQATASTDTTTVTGDTAVLEATFSSVDGLTGTHTVCEAGVFDASSAGTMLARALIGPLTLNFDVGDSLTVRWRIQVQ